MKKTIFTFLILVLFNIFTYSQISVEHLQLWLSADSVEIIGGKVARWYDLSPNSHLIQQSTEANRPVRVDNSLNNEPVITFNGTTTYLDGGDILNLSTNSNMIFFIAKGTRAVVSKSRAADATNRYSFILGANNFLAIYQDNILRNFSYTNTSFKNQKYNLFTITNNRALSKNKYYINSDSIGQSTILGSQNFTSTYNFLIGAYNNSTGGVPPLTNATYGYLNGNIAEIIIVDTVSDQLKFEIENYLFEKYSPCFNLPSTLQIDYGFCDTAVSIDGAYYDYNWSTGETTNSIQINQTGFYTIMARDSLFGRYCFDTIFVEFPDPNIQNISNCLDDSVHFAPTLIGVYDYIWSDLGTESSKYFKDAGDYWLRMEDSFGCFDTVFFSIAIDSFKNHISLGNDTSLCSGNTISLIEGEELCNSFLWTTNSNTNPIQTISESGWQKIEVENENGCAATDSIYVTIVGTAPTPGYSVENLCFGETTQFIDNSSPQADIAKWEWIINENDTLYTQNAEWLFSEIGIQNIQLIVESLAGCTNSVDFYIEILDVPVVSYNYSYVCVGTPMIFIPEVIPPSENTVTSYSWLLDGFEITNVENLEYVFEEAGLFELVFTSTISNGCSSSYASEVAVLDSYPVAGDFTLVSPHDCYYYSKNEVLEFQWNNSIDAVAYKILISGDQSFQANIYSQSNLDTNQITIPLSSLIDTIYWQVQSVNPCGVITSSDVRKLILFDYSTIANVALWLAADSTDAISNKVSKWYDLSPNMFEILQDNDEFKPVISVSALKNKPVVDFDGIDDYLDGGDILELGINSHTFIFIAKGQKSIFAKSRASGDPSRYAFVLNLNRMENLYHDNILRSYVYNDISFDNFDFNFYKLENQRNVSENKYYLNNNLIGTAPINGSYNLSSDYNFLIGAYNNSLGGIPPLVHTTYGYFDGSIAELIIIDSLLTESDYSLICNYLRDKYSNPVNLSYDIRVPYGFCDTAITTAYKPWFTSYSWSTGETDSIIHVNRPGVYSVTVTDIFGFESSDDIRVYYPPVNDFADTVVCFGNSVVWDAQIFGDYTYSWYGSGETTQQITITDEGNYAVIVYDTLGCQYLSDTISFSFDNYEFTASVGPADTALCSGNRIMLVTNRPETVSYLWSTGSTTPEIVLSETGTYSVTITNWRGCEASDEIDVTITGTVPVPLFSSEGHCAQNPVYFTDNSTSVDGTINYWSWVVNGLEFSNAQNPEITIDEPGTYPVTLSIRTDADCGDFVNTNLTIYPLPSVSFVPDYFCQWAPVDFVSTAQVEGGTVSENMWDFSGTQQIGDNIIYAFTQSGNNPITLTSTSDVGCRDSLVTEVYVKNSSLPVFSTENACEGSDIYFVNNTEVLAHNLPLEWNWDFGDGNTGTGSDPAHIYENAGIYDVSVNVVWQNMCEVPATAQVEVYNNPSLSLLAEDECINVPFSIQKTVESLSGEVVSYNWTFGSVNQQISASENPQFSSSVPGEYLVTLSIETEYGCGTNAVDTVIVHANPLASFAASRVWGAVPMEVEFTNNSEGASTYLWSFGDSGISSDEDPVYIYNSEGEFDIVLQSYSQFGCVDDTTIRIKTVIPVLDVILYDLRTVMSGNYLQTNVYVINNGTLPVYNAEITLDLGDGKLYREIIEYIAPSQVLDYKFSMEAYRADGKLPEVVCSEIYAPAFEGYAEINTDDNVLCNTDVNNLRVYQPYPNPATGELNVSFILESESDVTITFVNSIGEQVYKNNISNKTGYQKLLVDVSNFIPGVYYLQISAGDEVRSFKVEVL